MVVIGIIIIILLITTIINQLLIDYHIWLIQKGLNGEYFDSLVKRGIINRLFSNMCEIIYYLKKGINKILKTK